MKTKLFITVWSLILSVGLLSAQTQNNTQKQNEKTTSEQKGPAFVDKNNNLICENFENGTPGNKNANGKQRLLDGSGRNLGKGKGMRNGRGNGRGCGRNFVDNNNDGVCDNLKNRTPRRQNGTVDVTGLRNGRGYGRNFVDKNNDGICDRRQK